MELREGVSEGHCEGARSWAPSTTGQRPAQETLVAVATQPALTLLSPGRTRCNGARNHLSILSSGPAKRWPGNSTFESWSSRDTLAPLPGDRRFPFPGLPPFTFLSPKETILQLEVNTPQMRKVTTEPRFLMAFPHASGPGARQERAGNLRAAWRGRVGDAPI